MVVASVDRLCETLKPYLVAQTAKWETERGEKRRRREGSEREGSGRGGGVGGEKEGKGVAKRGEKRGGTKTRADWEAGKSKRGAKSGCHSCIWVAGRRIRLRVLGVIIKTPKIGLFVGDPKKLSV